MARTTTQLRDVVASEGGFDSTLWNTAIVGWLSERHKQMIVRAKWKIADDYAITTTVADQDEYTLPTGIVQVEWLEVAGTRYERASPAQIASLAASESFGGGVSWFAEAASADGATRQVRLFPVPEETGLAITAGRASVIPADLDTSSSNPILPEDLEPHLIAGAIATGKRRVEQRPDLAQPFEEEFEAGVVELKRRKGSRLGSGVVSIPVVGYHFRS